MSPSLAAGDAEAFSDTIAAGGVAVFPTDTVYGLGCDPETEAAVEHLYRLKGRRSDKPAAVMFFQAEPALAALAGAGQRTQRALEALLPGAVTLLLPNPEHLFPLACGPEPDVLGVRVPALPAALAALADVRRPVLQSSANLAGAPDARRLADVPEPVRGGADVLLDGGELPGAPSTVVDLRRFEADRSWDVLREGAVSIRELARALA